MDFIKKVATASSLPAGGAINGTAHLMRSNLQFLKDQKKRDRYLSQLSEMLAESQKSYRDVMAELG